MLPSSRQASHSRHIGCRHTACLHTRQLSDKSLFFCHARFILILSSISFFCTGVTEKPISKPLVAHRAYIRQQFVVGEWRNRHIVGIKHIGRFGVIIFCRHDQPIVPQSHVGTNVPGGTVLPLQVWIIVSYHAHRHRTANCLLTRYHSAAPYSWWYKKKFLQDFPNVHNPYEVSAS